MFNITNHQGNANQNHNEMSPHISQDGSYQKGITTTKKGITSIGEDVEKRNACALLVGIKI